MVRIIEELTPEWQRVLRHTFVQGRDGKHYKIITFQLYEKTPPPEFPNWEVNVEEVDERGKRRVLVQPVLKRFFDKKFALDFHQRLLDGFDEALHLPEPKKEEHKGAKAGGH
ncbi:MAG: hypothetical protein HYY16_10455 [Planctomycetes bacterium]|nr:hypothetical protein [Planctomycetota bacterium]